MARGSGLGFLLLFCEGSFCLVLNSSYMNNNHAYINSQYMNYVLFHIFMVECS
jgi:hypothetical protein